MPSKLLSPHEALGDYLDEMLHQATGEAGRSAVIEQRRKVVLPAQLPLQEALGEVDAGPAAPAADETSPAPDRGRTGLRFRQRLGEMRPVWPGSAGPTDAAQVGCGILVFRRVSIRYAGPSRAGCSGANLGGLPPS